jgi:hypothetical protein
VLTAPMPVVAFAAALGCAGDVDGYPELVVGSPNESAVYVYEGRPSGYADPPTLVLAGAPGTQFGTAVRGAGDVDGDGYADVVVGAPEVQATSESPVQGQATVYFGGPQGLSASHAAILPPVGKADEQSVGQYVSTAGDVNGDGLADVAVFQGISSTVDPQHIAIYLGASTGFGSAAGETLEYEAASVSFLGAANVLSSAGDVNGDGYADLVVATATPPCTPLQPDHLSLFLGGPSGLSLTASRVIDSPFASASLDHFGLSLATADFDGDGYDDVAASAACFETSPPDAVVYEGGPSDLALATTLTTDDSTVTLYRELGATDVDGDGYPDLVVGFPTRLTPALDAGPAADGGAVSLHGAVEVHAGGPGGVSKAATWTLLPPDETTVAYGASLAPP